MDSRFMQVFALNHISSSDFSFNDLYYRIQSEKSLEGQLHFYREKSVILINSGSIDTKFRSELAYLIDEINRHNPKVIGIDHTFLDDEWKEGTDKLKASFGESENIVLAHDPINEVTTSKYIGDGKRKGDVSFPDTLATMRNYYSHDSTFAFLLAREAFPDQAKAVSESKTFPIHYSCKGNGLKTASSQINFECLEARDILNGTINSKDLELLENKIIIIGHMGKERINNENDIEDKFAVPTDMKNITNRLPSMYGSVIHANAIENILHPETHFREWNGLWFIIFKELLIIAFLAFLLFLHFGKFINIMALTIITIPVLLIVLKLMEYNIYISMGATLLHLLLFEELVEIIGPTYSRVTKFKFKNHENK
tara:strand:+ start:340 stop:1446 length:1107 start_codon:yes stop_codon:yes gene_type:complete